MAAFGYSAILFAIGAVLVLQVRPGTNERTD
jgi:hypothetical protein